MATALMPKLWIPRRSLSGCQRPEETTVSGTCERFTMVSMPAPLPEPDRLLMQFVNDSH